MTKTVEKDHLQKALTIAFDEFISLVSSFDEHDINRKPFPDSWTPGQVATHIILACDGLPDTTTKSADREIDSYLHVIRPWWEDLTKKFKSPEFILPDDQPKLKSKLLLDLHGIKGKNLNLIEQKDLSQVCLDFELPGVGYLTRYEWLWFNQMHLKRHSFQLSNMTGLNKPVEYSAESGKR